MQARFLLGPAGSGKTARCLGEIRAALAASPEGLPLLLLAPKQATFQLERQLLADPVLPGYTRLQILSFDRLSEFILNELSAAPPELLGEEGRVMVLRALLAQRQKELKIFRATARLPGFAQQLSLLLRELQRHRLEPVHLLAAAGNLNAQPQLKDKLHDLALLLRAYLDWLQAHDLQDSDCLPDLAAVALRPALRTPHSALRLGGLWLDGFAEMTPQEQHLLAALMPCCDQATLAFCLEAEPGEERSWLSPWSVVAETFRQCRAHLAAVPGCTVAAEILPRRADEGRFAGNPVLQHLEQHWARPQPFSAAKFSEALSAVTCPDPEAEAVFAAREILRHVRAGGRYRECAVLLRQLDGHHDALRRVFTRYGIPFFLDRRELVAHHPLAELTRCALRTAAFDWRQEDWFGALKTGLSAADETEVDWLENAALEHGWEGQAWQQPLAAPGNESLAREAGRLRRKLVPPFLELAARLAGPVSGAQLATALRGLWSALKVEQRLEEWSAVAISQAHLSAANPVHQTVWGQMQTWLEDLERAFPGESEALPLREWLPILEAGLSGLTVGVIPPALDQVLVGTVDRSRNPDLKLALVLGLNEGIFPAPPAPGVLLTDIERAGLERQNVSLGPTSLWRLGHERYYGYIAFTRARARLVLTCAAANARGQPLNPSPFFAHLERLFPDLKPEPLPAAPAWTESGHACELIPPLLRREAAASSVSPAPAKTPALLALESLPAIAPAVVKWRQLAVARQNARLAPALAEKLHGVQLRTSVSGLEDFAACPFKFFVARGLRAGERKQFEVDQREKGSFQHEVLSEFHHRIQAAGKTWRQLSPAEAREGIGRIGEELLPRFRDGLFLASAAGQFTARLLIEGLQKLMETLIGWMPQYGFDPHTVEVEFGLQADGLPGWRLDLGDGHALLLRGRIDRVDLCRAGGTDAALAVVIDYKSGGRRLEPVKLHHGLELQLLGYLGALRALPDARARFDVARLVPAGVFYVNLRGGFNSGKNRTEVLGADPAARQGGYQHLGRFDAGCLGHFDNRGGPKGDQFKYSLNKDGALARRGNDALPPEDFRGLLDKVEAHLREYGRAIYDGDATVAPYRRNNETACDRCDFRSLCRFDPWTEPYRVLCLPPKPLEDATAKPKRAGKKKETAA